MAMQETLSQISQEVKERRLPPKSRQAQDAARNMMMALLLQDVLGILDEVASRFPQRSEASRSDRTT